MRTDIDFPFHFNQRGQTATLTGVAGEDEHIRDMLEQLIFTSPGERVNRPDFGSGVLQLIFAPNSPELAATLQFTMQAAIQRWLGDVLDLQALAVESNDAKITIDVQYVVRRTNQVQTAKFTRAA
jgi:hypothetical protein